MSVDRLVVTSRDIYPGQIISSTFVEDDEPKIVVFMVPSWDAYKADRRRIPSELFIGLMALLFVIALVSGVVIYGLQLASLAQAGYNNYINDNDRNGSDNSSRRTVRQ